VIGAIELIQCGDPELRQSALVQLNVMLEDPRLHSIFLEMDGLATLFDILDIALVSIRNCLREEFVHCSLTPFNSLLFSETRTYRRVPGVGQQRYQYSSKLVFASFENKVPPLPRRCFLTGHTQR